MKKQSDVQTLEWAGMFRVMHHCCGDFKGLLLEHTLKNSSRDGVEMLLLCLGKEAQSQSVMFGWGDEE